MQMFSNSGKMPDMNYKKKEYLLPEKTPFHIWAYSSLDNPK